MVHVHIEIQRTERDQEAVYEAAALEIASELGLPVVASDRPGLKDSVRDGETGFLVPYGDAAAFAGAALRILREPALFDRLSEAARQWAATFSWP